VSKITKEQREKIQSVIKTLSYRADQDEPATGNLGISSKSSISTSCPLKTRNSYLVEMAPARHIYSKRTKNIA
jgi:hypothetical protein